MRIKEYNEARKEFWSCIILSPICLGVSRILAFSEWKPIVSTQRRKELEQTQC